MRHFDVLLANAGFHKDDGKWVADGDFNTSLVELLRGMYNTCFSEDDGDDEMTFDRKRILSTKLIDLDIPVRLLNCLRQVDMRTLGDALSVKRTELLKIRHLGVGSLRSLDKIVNDCGLHYGKMTLREWNISKTMRKH